MNTAGAHKRLKGTFSKDKHNILFDEFKLNYNDEPDVFKRGSILLHEFNIDETFDDNKLLFIDSMELLLQSALLCFLSAYERGVIECLNNVIRSCSNVQDMFLLKPTYKLLSCCYI